MTIPGARYAFGVVHPGSPMLRIRYRAGVAVDPHGFPDWTPYARAMVELPPSTPDLGMDEARVVDVLAANEVMARSGDPLWTLDGAPTPTPAPTPTTPAGWTWAHVAMTRRLALVPVELHGSYRHLGGVSTGSADRGRRGLHAAAGSPPGIVVTERLSAEAVAAVEERLGYDLPTAYRDFLARTNGGQPASAAVHPRFGFLLDRRPFGVARDDRHQDLVYANAWFGDRLTAEWLAIGYVQGGLLAVRVSGGDEGSIWYYDDDDPRDDDAFTAADVCSRLLHRVAADFAAFWLALRPVPAALGDLARSSADGAGVPAPAGMGSGLPTARRPR